MEAEIGARMLERLDLVKLAPRRVLDAGSGPGRDAKALAARYRQAQVLALDVSLGMLRADPGRLRLFRRPSFLPVCGDITRLPFAAASIDLVWSNMALHWAGDSSAALSEIERVLAPEGLFLFSTLGPDTLRELRAAAGAARVHVFADMHDVGDLLLASGFASPVMDMEMLTISYPDAGALLSDLRRSGQTSARADRARGLAGRRFAARLRAALAPNATFEVVYGHAWKREQAKTVRVLRRVS